MRVEVARVLAAEQVSEAWKLYASAFEELRAAAAQRHVMHEKEFEQVMMDARVAKYIAIERASGDMAGLATFTNSLDAMPLISPEFFARRWPEFFRESRVWYLGFFAIAPHYRGSGTFEEVITQMWAEVRAKGGVAALDVCGLNSKVGLPVAIKRTLESLTPEVICEPVDVQTFWSFQLAESA